MPSDEHARLAKLMDWIRSNPALPHSLASMAEKAAMSTRTLQRHFKESTGLAPGEWLIRERVAIAKELLESPNTSLPQIAELAGFGSEESLRRHFRRIVANSPSSYRKQFAGTRTAIETA
jgi:AraC family transcriptional activator FtrA